MRETGTYYDTEWKCDAPAEGLKFTVVDQEWNDDYTVRTIREVRLITIQFA